MQTLFYGYPQSDSYPAQCLEGYLGYVDNQAVRSKLRRELLKVAPFTAAGKHTLRIKLDDVVVDNMIDGIPQLLQTAKIFALQDE